MASKYQNCAFFSCHNNGKLDWADEEFCALMSCDGALQADFNLLRDVNWEMASLEKLETLFKAASTGKAFAFDDELTYRLTDEPLSVRTLLKSFPSDGDEAIVRGSIVACDPSVDAALESMQEELEYQKNVLNTIADNIDGPVVVKNRAGEYLLVNRYFCDLVGKEQSALLGKNSDAAFPEEIAQKLIAGNNRVMDEAKKITFVDQGVLNGNKRYVLTNRMPLTNSAGQVIGLCGVGMDITAQKQIESQLRQKSSELNARVNELNCLYELSKQLHEEDLNVAAITMKLISVLLSALKAQHVCCIKVQLYGETWQNCQCDHVSAKQFSPIYVSGETAGELQVSFSGEAELSDPNEVQNLERFLEMVCDTYGRIVHKIQGDEAYRSLVDGSLEGLSIFQDYKIVFANQMLADITGYSVDELIAMSPEEVFSMVPPEDRERHYADMQKRLAGEDMPARKEMRIIRKDGEIRWVEGYAKLSSHRGRLADQVVYIDIHERKTLEDELLRYQRDLEKMVYQQTRELKNSEERYHRMFEFSPTIMALGNLKTRKVYEVNRAYCETLGITDRDAYIKGGARLGEWSVSDEDVKKLIDMLMANERIVDIPHKVIAADGRELDLRISGEAIEMNDERLVLLNIVDETESLKVKNSLAAQERFYRSLIEGSRDAFVFVESANGAIVDCNEAFCEMLGYTQDELKALTFYDITPKKWHDWEADDIINDQLMKRGYSDIYEKEYIRKDGTIFPIELSAYHYTDEAVGTDLLWATVRDITERKTNEAALRQADKMASLGVLVSGVAHEINNPNNFIMLNTSLVQDIWNDATAFFEKCCPSDNTVKLGEVAYGDAKKMVRDLLAGITDGSQRIRGIVEDLKSFARKDDGVEFDICDMNGVVSESVHLVGSIIKKSTKNFVVSTPKQPLHVWGSRQRLTQVLVNLLQNACEALQSENDGVTLRLAMNDSHCFVSVEDTGCGIPEQSLLNVTDPFYTTRREQGGTGLGLFVSAGIVKQHNGELWFTANSPQGTIATVKLPLQTEAHTGDDN